jgi:hypothetical protein
MKLIQGFILILLFFLMASCEKEKGVIEISGFTFCDENGDYIGEIDTTDWRLDDKWSEQIENLFKESSFKSGQDEYNQFKGIVLGEKDVYPAYPNPFKDIFIFSVVKQDTSGRIEIIIVDDDLNIKQSLGFDFEADKINVAFNTSAIGYKSKHAYRIYYKLTYSNSVCNRGHGDIKKY